MNFIMANRFSNSRGRSPERFLSLHTAKEQQCVGRRVELSNSEEVDTLLILKMQRETLYVLDRRLL